MNRTCQNIAFAIIQNAFRPPACCPGLTRLVGPSRASCAPPWAKKPPGRLPKFESVSICTCVSRRSNSGERRPKKRQRGPTNTLHGCQKGSICFRNVSMFMCVSGASNIGPRRPQDAKYGPPRPKIHASMWPIFWAEKAPASHSEFAHVLSALNAICH